MPSKHGNEVLPSDVLKGIAPAVEPSLRLVRTLVEQLAGVFTPSPCTPCNVPFPAPVEVIGGRSILPLLGNVTTAWLLPMLTAEPRVERLVGVVGGRVAPACRARAVTGGRVGSDAWRCARTTPPMVGKEMRSPTRGRRSRRR